jgi:diguanylate cyclase (GGDEF)-like protein
VTIALSMWNWYYDIKPRLENESQTNFRSLANAQARSIESQFQNIQGSTGVSAIHNSMNELLLFSDAVNGELLYLGASLEVDYDAFPVEFNSLNMKVGETVCRECISIENPIFNRNSGELIAIIKIHGNPIFYQRLITDIATNLVLNICGIMVMLILAWVTTNRLLKRLREREANLLHEISERKTAEVQLQQIATFDQLTQLPNRYLLQSEFIKKLEESNRLGHMVAALFFDLDHFKKVNDLHGHEAGDALLQEVARRMSAVTRNYDLLARFGGDEFVMIMSNLEDRTDVIPVVEKIITGFKREFDLASVSVRVTTSVGISIFPDDGANPSVLLKNADMAMYRAKAAGRNRYQFFNEDMNRDLQRAQWIETNIVEALDEGQFELFFQPHVTLGTDEISSCEALLRWPQVGGKNIEPSEFITIAERTGQIHLVSRWVMKRACEYLQQWQEAGLRSIRVDINLSGKDIVDRKIFLEMAETVAAHNLQPEQLGIEITENVLKDSSPTVIGALSDLRDSGVYISIDDFGTGYSSLNYLRNFPVSGLKIDQSFIHDAPANENDQIIMQAIVSVGLGLSVTAEGIESDQQFALCKGVQCDSIQGNFISEPLPADEFAKKFLQPK